MFNVPILLIGFNRSDLLIELIDLISHVQPREIYIAIDGPRPDNSHDVTEVEKCRLAVADINWDCVIRTKFSEVNLGCGAAVSSAISWAFSTCDNLIIIEDDIRPDLSFFNFAEEMLRKYKDDDSVQTISAYSNFDDSSRNNSYHFSAYPEIWGWATWRSTWEMYQFELNKIQKSIIWDLLLINKGNIIITLMMVLSFFSVSKKQIDTWDYQLVYLSVIKKGLHVIPNVNLIQNVGFGGNATHTKFVPKLEPTSSPIHFPLNHKEGIFVDQKKDRLTRKIQTRQLVWSFKHQLKFMLQKRIKNKTQELHENAT